MQVGSGAGRGRKQGANRQQMGHMKTETTMNQLELFKPEVEECQHRSQFCTEAYVPGGYVCSQCGLLLCQVLPQSPEVVGYLTSDWAWHYRDGQPWTTQEEPPSRERRSLAVLRLHAGDARMMP